ncbi:MAG TPA: sulfurtransferase TusA family protein [Anaerolineales bacterium]
MIETQVKDRQVTMSSEQRFGEDWIRAIAEGALERLETFCQPRVNSRLLTPGQFTNLDKAADLVAKYSDWFEGCTDFEVEASRIDRIGKRLGIFYRFLLRDRDDWYRIEQQLFCTLKDGRVQQLHLLCSGFQRVETDKEINPMDSQKESGQTPAHDEVLEFLSDAPDTAATCAILTPLIRSKLDEMHSGQVLEVRVNDPAARGDVESWSRLSGNPLLKVVDDDPHLLRFFVKKK